MTDEEFYNYDDNSNICWIFTVYWHWPIYIYIYMSVCVDDSKSEIFNLFIILWLA